MSRGIIIIISAPSGAGKTSIAKALAASDKKITLSVSYTTREPRIGEKNGVDYNFVQKDYIEHLISIDDVLEHAEVFGNYYCTRKSNVESLTNIGFDVILTIDWQGADQIEHNISSSQPLIKIFIMPPSNEELRKRLVDRGTDSAEIINNRMLQAKREMDHASGYDYVITNNLLENTIEDVRNIILAERKKINDTD